MKEKLLTIIIPAYNVSEYIEQCLNSLTKINSDELQILVIDDGSEDDTLEKARKYETDFPAMVEIIHKENGGHGSTINIGLHYATGKYLRVLDGDDWMDDTALVSQLILLEKSEADLILTNVVQMYPDKITTQKFFTQLERGKLYQIDAIPQIDFLTMGAATVKTEKLKQNGVHITEHCYYVDIEFNVYCLAYSESMEVYDLPVYRYRLGNSTQSTVKANMFRNIEMLKKVSLGLLKFYEHLDLAAGSRRELLLLRIGKLVRTTMLLHLADQDTDHGFKNWKEYNDTVRKQSLNVYSYLKRKWMIMKALCIGNKYIFYLMSKLYRLCEM